MVGMARMELVIAAQGGQGHGHRARRYLLPPGIVNPGGRFGHMLQPFNGAPTHTSGRRRRALPESEAQDLSIVERLRHSQQRLQFFLDHAPGAMAMMDRDMRYIAVNREWWEHPTFGGAALVGRCHYDVYPDLNPAWREAHRQGLAGHPRPCRAGTGAAAGWDDHLAALGSATLAGGRRQRWRHRPLRRGRHRASRIGRCGAAGPPGSRRTHQHNRRHRVGSGRGELPLHVRQPAGRAHPRLSGERLAGGSRLLGCSHPPDRPRGVGALLPGMYRGRGRPPVRLPDDRRRRPGGLAPGPRHRALAGRTAVDAGRRHGRHDRPQAGRGGAARKRGALPRARRHRADDGVGRQRRRPARLPQPALDRLLRTRPP